MSSFHCVRIQYLAYRLRSVLNAHERRRAGSYGISPETQYCGQWHLSWQLNQLTAESNSQTILSLLLNCRCLTARWTKENPGITWRGWMVVKEARLGQVVGQVLRNFKWECGNLKSKAGAWLGLHGLTRNTGRLSTNINIVISKNTCFGRMRYRF